MKIVDALSLAIRKENPEKKEILDRVKRIALQAIAELVIALALAALSIPFLSGLPMVLLTVGVSVGGIALMTITRFAALWIFQKSDNPLVRSTCSTLFAGACLSNTAVLVHELGHFGAAKALFGGSPTISITPFVKGLTSFSTQCLEPLGRFLGSQRCIFIVTLAGPALGLLSAAVALVAGLALRNNHPTIGTHLIAYGLMDFANHAIYACTALFASATNLGNDFLRLWTLGIHPIAALAAIVAIPIIIILGSVLVNKLSELALRHHRNAQLLCHA